MEFKFGSPKEPIFPPISVGSLGAFLKTPKHTIQKQEEDSYASNHDGAGKGSLVRLFDGLS